MTAYRTPALATAAALALAAAGGRAARAHHDVEATIALLTERIEAGEADADLYYRRATEYRVLRKPQLAEADLRQALAQRWDYTPAHRELARLLAGRGEAEAALASATRAVDNARGAGERAGAMVLMARLLSASGQKAAALEACDAAFAQLPAGDVDWHLLRTELLSELGRGGERPAALQAGFAATGSIVLRNAWVDALLDNGDTSGALPVIEEELASSRLKSSWLLRRGRAHLLEGDREAARGNLEACLEELAGRIHPARPDLTLLADRGLARALLGDTEAARADLARARAAGADRWVTAALERALGGD